MHYIFSRINKTLVVAALLGIPLYLCLPSAQAEEKKTPPEANPRPSIQIRQGPLEQINKYFSTQTITYSDGTSLVKEIINGPPTPPPGYELERLTVTLPEPNPQMGINIMTVPAFNWVFGCSSVSGAMIAGYYDRNGFPNMYTGPTNGGVMPLNNSSWPTWSDGQNTYPNLPLAASHNGVDGRTTRGSIDDYWVQYDSLAQDPYITNGWTQHTWADAIGDYMKTSQSAYGNTDGSTNFWNYTYSASQLTCNDMETFTSGGHTLSWDDGTYGRKLFYEARGYTVTDCYNQKTDNTVTGGFSFAQYKAEIDAGRPVMLNLAGHTIVGVGYDDTDNTVYIHDTWDYSNHTMTWGDSYSSLELRSVSVVNLQPAASPCPCPANGVISDVAYPSGTCSCDNATNLTIGAGVTIPAGAIVNFTAGVAITVSSGLTIPAGAIVNFSAGVAITVGSGLTLSSGATATFTAPLVTMEPGFQAAEGAAVTIRQP